MRILFALVFLIAGSIQSVQAGVTNPNISAIGQLLGAYTDDSTSASPNQPTLELGETELMFEAALNPYFNGAIVLSLATDGVEIEEAYTTMIKGLPLNMALKGGKYRVGFGRLNPAHPHTYPFIRTPRVMDPSMGQLLPGEESFNETGVQASSLIPVAGSYSLLLSGDLLQGNSFHPDTTTADFGWIGRIVNSFVLGDDIAPSELGFSIAQGTNDPANGTKALILGADLKSRIALSATLKMTVQGEYVYKNAEHIDALSMISHEKRGGFYAFADARSANHFNGGLLYEQYQAPDDADKTDRAIKPFIGYAVLEESTLLQLTYEYFIPHDQAGVNSVELQLIYSMGPHKAHQF
ncbi:MAG: hypothetical protein V1913_16020 [Fibrobacterota bacterium]